MDGQRQGHWVARRADGRVWEGPVVDGKMHGHWVWRKADGSVWEVPYVDGKRHGDWVRREADGSMYDLSYMTGKQVSSVRRKGAPAGAESQSIIRKQPEARGEPNHWFSRMIRARSFGIFMGAITPVFFGLLFVFRGIEPFSYTESFGLILFSVFLGAGITTLHLPPSGLRKVLGVVSAVGYGILAIMSVFFFTAADERWFAAGVLGFFALGMIWTAFSKDED